MLKELTITLLKASLAEAGPGGYKQCTDRILTALDKGRRAVYPASSRTPEQMASISAAYQEATRQIAKTYLKQDVQEEELAYLCLTGLGRNLPLKGLRFLLQSTLARLEKEQAEQPDTAEAAP